MDKKQAEDKVTDILRKAEESAGRSFELGKEYLDRDIKLTYTPHQQDFVSEQIEKRVNIIKGHTGFEYLMSDLPTHIRRYNPKSDRSRRSAIIDLIRKRASEDDLFRVFTMKYVAYLEIDYLKSWMNLNGKKGPTRRPTSDQRD
jgi:5'-deoxynucleotidase YfbR-like HD superfamily hydrolase